MDPHYLLYFLFDLPLAAPRIIRELRIWSKERRRHKLVTEAFHLTLSPEVIRYLDSADESRHQPQAASQASDPADSQLGSGEARLP